MRCPTCGAVNAANALACGQCGASVFDRASAAARPLPVLPMPPPRPHAPAPLPTRAPTRAGPADVPWRGAALLLAYVFVSSYLGLTGRFAFLAAPRESFAFMGEVWGASVAADLVFVLGTMATGVAAYLLARNRQTLAALLAALALTWTTYALSWTLVLLEDSGFAEGGWAGFGETVAFVGAFGVVGIVFATLAPVVVGLRDRAEAAERGHARVPVDA